ncbi:MAG TPA: Lrp/AsnC family transcriptional regulator [Nitrososphaerales archaeon]|jgi:DNA-binding Lrp family transcriptional regulator|nr:Lrp/AsnC family transcriptional regulator [Nitrososphaerota archaeon]NSL77462.1 Lrp/AsnC family transcriptional regulator [Nitrososphaerota archaeon]HIC84293.1 Lrp/AsnC family transcriptional regulator [Nitrososphaerales archaeon]HIM82282.1 Lrp/AsnC family transcriptional regulator [Nitrososphaerales archaeon]|tara:strand:+ start:286 stop:513 length:228 start_codon:yes stop_codon:yes gene_type:complete
MSLAYVLINAEIGKEKLCYNEVKQLGNVKEVYILYGFYDIIAIVESSNINKVNNALKNIRQNENVMTTETMPIIE